MHKPYYRRFSSMEKPIYITEFDLVRLKALLRSRDPFVSGNQHLEDLDRELRRAVVVSPHEIPPDVITMNSTFRLKDLDTGEEGIYTLVFPGRANVERGMISVLAPVGTALLGYRLDDVVEWDVPVGRKRFRIEGILYQPEAAGDYDL